jgi:hypothetical protein
MIIWEIVTKFKDNWEINTKMDNLEKSGGVT